MSKLGTLGYQLELYGSFRRAVRRYSPERDMAAAPFPTTIQLQTINACQAACVMCPYTTYAKVFPRGRMDDALLEKVMAEVAAHPEVRSFIPMLQNEPLLDRRLFERVRSFKAAAGPRTRVELVTNGALLTDDVVAQIRDVGLDILDISLDALTRDTYQRIRIGLDFDAVIAGVERVIAADLPRTSVFVRLVRQRANRHEIQPFISRWRSRGVGVFVYSAHDRAGSVAAFDDKVRIPARELPVLHRLERLASRLAFGRCPIPFTTANILHDGTMLMCVHDWGRKVVVGNVRDATIAELWNGPRMRELRRLVWERRYDEVASCRDCSLQRDGWF
ncbi:MAG TPA: radical SAM/SPASM domain-containing protein [Gemmatimonadaceae bacterium]|nr:radical SAM/SPASM domain-containing protein [Gemmatimonadaceae bacterium]